MSLGDVKTVRNRYATGAATTTPIIGSLVLLLTAMKGMTRFDYSNLKTFRAPTSTGQKRAVYVRQIGDKRWRIAVDFGPGNSRLSRAPSARR